MRKYIAEFIGTFVLVAFGCGSAVAANIIFMNMGSPIPIAFTTLLISVAFGLTIVAMAYSIGNISGCHVNPAVSLAMLIDGRMNVKDFIGYLVGQFLGALGAALFLMLLFKEREILGVNGYGSASAMGIPMMGALAAEIVMTFVFVLVILGVTSKEEYKSVAGLVIGFSLTLVHVFGVPLTGTSVNPARSFGPAVVTGGEALAQLPVFIIAPLIGGALAAVVFRFLLREPVVDAVVDAVEEEAGEENDTAEEAGETEEASDEEAGIISTVTEKIAAGIAATEELLEESGNDFEEAYDKMVSDETGLEEVAAVLDEAGDKFEEAYDKMVSDETGLEEVTAVLDEAGDKFEEAYDSMVSDHGEKEEKEEKEEDSFGETYDLLRGKKHKKKEESAEEEEKPAEEEAPAEEEEKPAEEEAPAEEEEKPAEEEAPAEEEEKPAEEEALAEEEEKLAEEEAPAEEEEKPAEEEALAEEEKKSGGKKGKGSKHKRQGGRKKKNPKHQK